MFLIYELKRDLNISPVKSVLFKEMNKIVKTSVARTDKTQTLDLLNM